jgi:hypothetical protein
MVPRRIVIMTAKKKASALEAPKIPADLPEKVWPEHGLDIEVMKWNNTGYAFWKSLGFIERSGYMRLEERMIKYRLELRL